MPRYRHALPQRERQFLTDGGIETWFVFKEGFKLPYFAAFDLLRSEAGRAAMTAYYERYMAIARAHGAGFILESPTWRASADWGAKMGLGARVMDAINRDAIALMTSLRERHSASAAPVVISGCVGPRGDGYVAGDLMTAQEAADYHDAQIRAFAETEADMIAAITMTNIPEAMGVARAARARAMPVAISFTVETDGRLPAGDALADAIAAVDEDSGGDVAYYMINCAHPSHFERVFADGGAWVSRVRGLRCNASQCSHAELDNATTLDDGDPAALGAEYARLGALLPALAVFGGCCGTDHRHVEAIARNVLRDAMAA